MVRNSVNRLWGGLLLACALAGAQSAHADAKKMVLMRPIKAGMVATYKATIKASIQGMDIQLEQSQKQTIKSIKDDGTTVTLAEDLGGTIKLNGMDQEQKPGPPSTETRDKLGKLLEFTHESDANAPFAPEVQKLMTGIGELLMTDKEVGDGDTWDTTLENPVIKEQKVKVKTTYQGIEKVGGVDLWKFKQVAEAVVNADGSKMTNDSIIWMNPKDGLTEKIEGKIKGLPTQFGPMDVEIVIKRGKTEAAAPVKADK